MNFTLETEPNVTDCDSAVSKDIFLHSSLVPAVLIVVVLSCLQRRKMKHTLDQRCPCLQRRFGIVIPMDAMGFSNRWSYGFAFGAVSYSVLELFYEQHIPKMFPHWAKSIAYLIGSFEVGLAYFPFFACLTTTSRKTGAVMGILYSIFWILTIGWDWFTCPDGEEWGRYQKLIYQWPWMLSLIFLFGRYIFILVQAVCLQRKVEQENWEEFIHAHQIEHVKRLLRRTAQSKPLNWFERHVYVWDPHFKFPNRLIGTAIISVLTLYTVTIAELGLTTRLFQMLQAYFFPETPSYHTPAPGSAEELLNVAKICMHVTLASASLNMVVYVVHMLVCYRKQIKRLWKGQKDFLPKKLQAINSAVSVISIAKYSGWQIAFILWGFVIIRIMQLIVALIIAVVALSIKYGNFWNLFEELVPMLVAFAVVFVLFKLQVLAVRFFFLQEKMSPTDKENPLALNNRNGFNCFNYFFFFYNVVLGVAGCVHRIMISLLLGTCLVSRIDRTILQKGYETMDKGFRTWVGMIFADHYHNNPVMLNFCQLLLSHTQKREHDSDSFLLNIAPCDSARIRARKRWSLFYTLLMNPHLIPLRGHHLSAKVPLKASSSAQADIVVQAWLMRSEAATEIGTTEKC